MTGKQRIRAVFCGKRAIETQTAVTPTAAGSHRKDRGRFRPSRSRNEVELVLITRGPFRGDEVEGGTGISFFF